jgi:YtkA-like
MMMRRALVIVAISTAVGVGCSSAPTVAAASCADDPRVEAFQTGLVSKGVAGSTVTITTSTPTMVQQGLNEWVVSITDSTGQPVVGTVTETALMPDHGHGSPTPSTVTSMGNGQYDIAGINLSMIGVWTITVAVSNATMSDSATFTFCIDGATS